MVQDRIIDLKLNDGRGEQQAMLAAGWWSGGVDIFRNDVETGWGKHLCIASREVTKMEEEPGALLSWTGRNRVVRGCGPLISIIDGNTGDILWEKRLGNGCSCRGIASTLRAGILVMDRNGQLQSLVPHRDGADDGGSRDVELPELQQWYPISRSVNGSVEWDPDSTDRLHVYVSEEREGRRKFIDLALPVGFRRKDHPQFQAASDFLTVTEENCVFVHRLDSSMHSSTWKAIVPGYKILTSVMCTDGRGYDLGLEQVSTATTYLATIGTSILTLWNLHQHIHLCDISLDGIIVDHPSPKRNLLAVGASYAPPTVALILPDSVHSSILDVHIFTVPPLSTPSDSPSPSSHQHYRLTLPFTHLSSSSTSLHALGIWHTFPTEQTIFTLLLEYLTPSPIYIYAQLTYNCNSNSTVTLTSISPRKQTRHPIDLLRLQPYPH